MDSTALIRSEMGLHSGPRYIPNKQGILLLLSYVYLI